MTTTENTSAESPENTLRDRIESAGNWLWVMRDMEDEFFKQAFRELMVHPEAQTSVEIKCEKYFLLLSHTNPLVQHSGLCYFNEIYNEAEEVLKEKYHYTKKDFAEDAIKKGIAQLMLNQ